MSDTTRATKTTGLTRREVLKGAAAAGGALAFVHPGLARAMRLSSVLQSAGVSNLRWALDGQPTSLDMATNFTGTGMTVFYQTNQTLMTYSPSLHLVPGVAKSVSVPTPTRYVYALRDDLHFSDGSPLTAEDVSYSLNRHIDPAVDSQVSFYFAGVKKIEATGPYEVTVTLTALNTLYQYAPVFAPIIPKAFGEAQGKSLGAPGKPWVGSGPYMVKSYNDVGIVLVRNPYFSGAKPLADQVTYSYIEDPNTLQLAMQSGQIDGTFNVSVADTASFQKETPNVAIEVSPGLVSNVICINVEAEPWSDVHVRRAFAYALDQEGIIRAILHGGGQAANTMVPPQQWGSVLTSAQVAALYKQIPSYPFDLTKAKAELQMSKWPNGFDTSIMIPSSRQYIVEAMLAFSNDLKTIGINLKVESVPIAVYRAYYHAHKDLGLTNLYITPDYPDPADYLVTFYPSANAVANNWNLANFKDATVDKLLDEQAGTIDNAKRAEYIGQILKISGAEMPYLTLWWEDSVLALRKGLKMANFNAFYLNEQWTETVEP